MKCANATRFVPEAQSATVCFAQATPKTYTSIFHFTPIPATCLAQKMLPLVDPEVRSSNPKFDALYNDLCNNKLNADGTTKLDAKAQREHDSLSEVCA